MKKKILAIAIAAIMLVTAIASVSLAYMTDTDEQTNVMTVGKVEIDQLEYERVLVDSDNDGIMEWVSTEATDTYGYIPDEIQPFSQDKPLYPVVCLDTLGTNGEGNMKWDDRVSGHQQSWAQVGAPGSNQLFDDSCKNVIDKFVFVKNTGKSDCYVRTLFAFEQGDLTAAEFDEMVGINVNPQWEGGIVATDVKIEGNTYAIICYTYRGPNKNTAQGGILKPDEVSRPSLLQVYLASKATNDTVEKIDGNNNGIYEILTLSQAVQTNGFVNETNDLNNSTLALNTAFGKVTAEKAIEWFAEQAKALYPAE